MCGWRIVLEYCPAGCSDADASVLSAPGLVVPLAQVLGM